MRESVRCTRDHRAARTLLQRLGEYLNGFSACFSRRLQRAAASRYLDGLFNDNERKSMQAMHGRLGDPQDWQALQHFITHSPWDAAARWQQRARGAGEPSNQL